MTTPDWLAARNGAVVQGLSEKTILVTLGGEPMWRLDALPAGGNFTVAVLQTNSGKRMDDGRTYPTMAAALAGGLDELRSKLGW